MTVSTIKMTSAQFLQLGEDPPGVRLELVDGEIAVSPSPSPDHSYSDTQLRVLLARYVDEHDLGQVFGDVDTIFGPHDVRRPDVIYFAKSRLHLVSETAMEGPPDLCVEIISPSSTTVDREDKFRLYERSGVAYYWVVDPQARTIEAYRLVNGRYVACGRGSGNEVVKFPPFEALSLPLAKLWRPKFGE